jgi:hypothetical protein
MTQQDKSYGKLQILTIQPIFSGILDFCPRRKNVDFGQILTTKNAFRWTFRYGVS